MINHYEKLFIVLLISSLSLTAKSCAPLPPYLTYGNVVFQLIQGAECRGGKVYEIQNVQDTDQCSEACLQYHCAAVNVFNTEFGYVCEILGTFMGVVPAQGAACYAPWM